MTAPRMPAEIRLFLDEFEEGNCVRAMHVLAGFFEGCATKKDQAPELVPRLQHCAEACWVMAMELAVIGERQRAHVQTAAPSAAAWVPCPDCGEAFCRIHQEHAADCACPLIEDWDVDPFTTGGPGAS